MEIEGKTQPALVVLVLVENACFPQFKAKFCLKDRQQFKEKFCLKDSQKMRPWSFVYFRQGKLGGKVL